MAINLFVFDLSGVLFKTSQTRPMPGASNEEWTQFYEACMALDKPRPEMARLFSALRESGQAIIWTGRPNTFQRRTIEQLESFKNDFRYLDDSYNPWYLYDFILANSPMLMRPAGDHRPNAMLKKSWAKQLINLPSSIIDLSELRLTFFENNLDSATVLAEFGTVCLLCGDNEDAQKEKEAAA